METAGNHSAPRQPDRVQATNADREHIERAFTQIHAARAAIDAAEVHLQQRDGPLTGHDVAASLCLVNAERCCFQAIEIITELELGADAERSRRRSYRPPE